MPGTVEFTFTPEDGNSVVTLAMYGHRNFMMKAMSVVISCSKMFGPKLEKSLADLGAAASGARTR